MLQTTQPRTVSNGLVWGFIGVAAFSLTFPATRFAQQAFDPLVVVMGRAVLAGGIAALLLWRTHQPWPARRYLARLGLISFGIVLGFPFLAGWALQRVPAAHGAVINGLLPLVTAVVATLRGSERPGKQFWVASGLGSVAVVAFALRNGLGHLELADLALVVAVIAAAIGYAEGARLAAILGSWQVISWAVVLMAPILVVPFAVALHRRGLVAPPSAWLGFAYVALISQYLGFFAWYRGLTLGGVARVSQLQLIQPFLTIIASALLLHEQITGSMLVAALVVIVAVAWGRSATVTRPTAPQYNLTTLVPPQSSPTGHHAPGTCVTRGTSSNHPTHVLCEGCSSDCIRSTSNNRA